MTEFFVSGTEVFSDAKMTETPYEWRMVDMYANGISIKCTCNSNMSRRMLDGDIPGKEVEDGQT